MKAYDIGHRIGFVIGVAFAALPVAIVLGLALRWLR